MNKSSSNLHKSDLQDRYQPHFGTIALIGHPRQSSALSTHKLLFEWLLAEGYEVLVEETLAPKLQFLNMQIASLDEIGTKADLAVVIGGDGNMLRAARVLSSYDIQVIGVNRGQLGFLTDLDPDDVIVHIKRVLMGDYVQETRFLLDVEVKNSLGTEAKTARNKESLSRSNAINEAVLHPRKIAHMIDFEVYIDEKFAFGQKADGLIIATPTGSTAYSLSAGGPILTPDLNALLLVPMFPHRLTVRPLVVSGNSQIYLKFPTIKNKLEINCDSQIALPIHSGDEVLIRKASESLKLIHPTEYSYFNTLSNKLHWLQ